MPERGAERLPIFRANGLAADRCPAVLASRDYFGRRREIGASSRGFRGETMTHGKTRPRDAREGGHPPLGARATARVEARDPSAAS